MSKPFCFGVVALPLVLGLFSGCLAAQDAKPEAPPTSAPDNSAVPAPAVAPTKGPPPKDPYVLEDGGLYIEPIYWLNKAQPQLHGGKTATAFGNFDYNGNAKAGVGGEIGIPAGRSNTLRINFFRVQGNAGVTLAKDTAILSRGYTAGDFINATHKTQGVKISWDYLSYTWRKPNTAIHLKTLWEFQYVTSKINTAAPFKASSVDASGTTNDNLASGSKSVALPTFGMALGSQLGKHFRWDIRGSGFGLPHRAAIADAQASIALMVGRIELIVGDRFYYFKTSPNSNLFVTDRMNGVFGGIRFGWKGKP
jgi:hypothetical protein